MSRPVIRTSLPDFADAVAQLEGVANAWTGELLKYTHSSFDPFFGRLRSSRARSSRVGSAIPSAFASSIRNPR